MMSEQEQQAQQPQETMPDPVHRNEERPERRSYTHVDNEKRNELITLLESKSKTTIKNAAIQVGVNYECAKAIYRAYRLEDRTQKKDRSVSQCGSPEHRQFFIIHRKRSRPEAVLGGRHMLSSISTLESNDDGALTPRLPPIKMLAGYR